MAASHNRLGGIYSCKINLGPFELRLERNKEIWLIVVLAPFFFFSSLPTGGRARCVVILFSNQSQVTLNEVMAKKMD